jgi:hypothetical protein
MPGTYGGDEWQLRQLDGVDTRKGHSSRWDVTSRHVEVTMGSSEYTPEDDAALSAGLQRTYRRGRPSPRDEQIADEDRAAAEYLPKLAEPDDL